MAKLVDKAKDREIARLRQALKAANQSIASFKATTVSKGPKRGWTENGNSGTWSFNGEAEDIQTLDDALAFSGVDLSVWEVDRHEFNKWPTTMKIGIGEDTKVVQRANVQIKVWFKKRVDHDIDWAKVHKDVLAAIRGRNSAKAVKGSGIGVCAAADLHFGAYIDDLIRADKFSITTLIASLQRIVERVNAKRMTEVHVFLLGDFIESFTGLNHRNSWKGLAKGQFGVQATILCFETLVNAFLGKIKNLKSVTMVSGNHDRVTSDSELDPKGEVAELLAYMIDREMRDVEVFFNPLVVNRVIDGISYICTHGHHRMAKKEIQQLIMDYGKQGLFNVFLQGHLHSRQVTKTWKKNQYKVKDVQVIGLDEVDCRRVVVPPLFTGNFYSESSGFSSTAGFNWFENNGNGKIRFEDECV